MTCNFRIIVKSHAIDLKSPMDWFCCQAAILEAMHIPDAGPVLSEAEGNRRCNEAMRRAQAAKEVKRRKGEK